MKVRVYDSSSVEMLKADNIPIELLSKDFDIAMYNINNNKLYENEEFETIFDMAYMEALENSICRTSYYMPEIIYSFINKVSKKFRCSMRMASVYATTSGMLATIEELKTEMVLNSHISDILDIIRPSITLNKMLPYNSSSLLSSMEESTDTIKKIGFHDSKRDVSGLKSVIGSIGNISNEFFVAKNVVLKLFICNGVIISTLFSDDDKRVANVLKIDIMEYMKKRRNELSHEYRTSYILHKNHLDENKEERIKKIEKIEHIVDKIDEIKGTRHCKFCYSTNTVKKGVYKGRQKYKCNDCEKVFTPKQIL